MPRVPTLCGMCILSFALLWIFCFELFFVFSSLPKRYPLLYAWDDTYTAMEASETIIEVFRAETGFRDPYRIYHHQGAHLKVNYNLYLTDHLLAFISHDNRLDVNFVQVYDIKTEETSRLYPCMSLSAICGHWMKIVNSSMIQVLCLSLTSRWRVDFEKTSQEKDWIKTNVIELN